MKTIDELQAELRLICSELEKLKESQKAETREVNFREIAARAERYPISGHPMVNEVEHTKDMYILMLLSVAALDDEKYEESFMTIYRIAFGMNFSGNIESLFLSAKSMKFETLDECTWLFLNSKLRLVLLLECMMIAAGFENGKRRAMEYISQLAVMLNVSKDDIEFLANLARVVLTQDLNEYKTDKLNVYGDIFDFYIDTFAYSFDIQLIYSTVLTKANSNSNNMYALYSIQMENEKIVFKFAEPLGFAGFFGGCFLNDLSSKNRLNFDNKIENIISTNNMIVNVLDSELPNIYIEPYSSQMEHLFRKNFLFGVMSNHPLAHSKAIAQYIAAGGVIDKQEK